MDAMEEKIYAKVAAQMHPPPLKAVAKNYARPSDLQGDQNKHHMGFWEKKLMSRDGQYVLNPNVMRDTVDKDSIHTRSGAKYIKNMESICSGVDDMRATGMLAMGVHPSIRSTVKSHCDLYTPILPDGTPNPQNRWSHLCTYLDSYYKLGDGPTDIRKALLALRPERESGTNFALQKFQSEFWDLKAQLRALDVPGGVSNDPFHTAELERGHVLGVVQIELRHMYEQAHLYSEDTTLDTTRFWYEMMKLRQNFAEKQSHGAVKKVTYDRMEARPRDESQSYTPPEEGTCYFCGEKGHYTPKCPERAAFIEKMNEKRAREGKPPVDTRPRERSRDRSRDRTPDRGRSRERSQTKPANAWNNDRDNRNRSSDRGRSEERRRDDSRGRTPRRPDDDRPARLNALATEAKAPEEAQTVAKLPENMVIC